MSVFGAQVKLDGRPEGVVDLTDDLANRAGIYGTENLSGGRNGVTAFDNDHTNPTTEGRFGGNNKPFSCTYQFKLPQIVNKIGIMNQFLDGWDPTKRSPRKFCLKAAQTPDASADQWVTLLAVENEPIWAAGEWRYWSFDNTTKYTCYRLELIDSNNGDTGYIIIQELELYGLLNMIEVSGTPAAYGTVSPVYGSSSVATDGTPTTLSVVQAAYDDGKTCVVLGEEGRRIFLEHCEIFLDGASVKTSDVSPFDYIAPSAFNALQAVWSFTNEQFRTVASTTAGGTVTLGGVTASPVTNWTTSGTSVRLVATPDATHRFVTWTGDTDGVDVFATEQDLPATCARSLTATFVEKPQREPTVSTWIGADGADWMNADNWDNGLPIDGDTVVITNRADRTINLVGPTPELAKLVISNAANATTKLVCSNWFTRIRAAEVEVGKGGVITCAGPFGNGAMSNRVWIVAGTLMVQKGGSINADNRGWKPCTGPCWAGGRRLGYGGCGVYGAPYGGEAAYGYGSPSQWPIPYGSAKWPYDPGSGSSDWNTSKGPGGGAIFLDVTGDVTVEGTVSANATDYNYAAGSGGGVLIKCRTILGSGTISASATATGRSGTKCGGSGRIAVHYDPSAQSNATCTVTFDVFGGIGKNLGYTEGSVVKSESDIGDLEEGVRVHLPGSLWFPDNQFLLHSEAYKTAGYPFLGTWNSDEPLEGLHWTGDRTLNKTRLYFDRGGFDFTMDGNLTLVGDGDCGRIVYGLLFTNANVTVNGDLTLRASRLQMTGGKLTVNGAVETAYVNDAKFGGGEIALYALPTNAPASYGSEAEFNGHVHLSKRSVIAPFCHRTNGSVVRLKAKSLTIDEGGKIDADTKGYNTGKGPGQKMNGSKGYGGAYGGQGGIAATGSSGSSRNLSYGDFKRPLDPGSGNSYCAGFNACGGGLVLLEVEDTMVLNGLVTADGNRMCYGHYDWYSGSSGGGIYIRARHFSGTGTIRARGGITQPSGGGYPAAGGGGRVALWTRDVDKLADFAENNIDVSAGTAWGLSENGGAEDGTVYLRFLDPGLSILVR